jgi:DNA (cytosine-5)-methyltransferase 1
MLAMELSLWVSSCRGACGMTMPVHSCDDVVALLKIQNQSTTRQANFPATAGNELRIGSMCTGYGGLDLGVLAAFGGGQVVWCADPDPHVNSILVKRIPDARNLGDIRKVDWAAVEPVHVVTAGFPCQDISSAGRRMGIEKGERSGLWADIVAAVRILRPAFLIVENVAALRWKNGGLHRVLGDLAEAGYDALWRSVSASDVGAAHRRERVFLLAWHRAFATRDAANTDGSRRRPTRTSRPSSSAGARASGQPARRGEHCGCRATNSEGHRRNEGLPRTARFQGRSDAAISRHSDTCGSGAGKRQVVGDGLTEPASSASRAEPSLDWGVYATAVHRWEHMLGRKVPHPTQPGRRGRPVLAPTFVEHLMGLPRGWVTDIPLSRAVQLRALGNGVVPQQAAYAVASLLMDLDNYMTDNGIRTADMPLLAKIAPYSAPTSADEDCEEGRAA